MEKITLRRVAQFIQDLRTLNILKEKDYVEVTLWGDKIHFLIILKETLREVDQKNLKVAFQSEFSKKIIKMDEDNYCNIAVTLRV